MDNRAIGVFDSGVGGLTAVKELKRLLPNEDIVYFGDTGRVPYGTRSRETLISYIKQDLNFLKKQNVKMIVAACGTVSATVTSEILSGLDVPFTGVVLPTAKMAVEVSTSGKIGVIGTNATVNSGAFEKAIKSFDESATVVSKPCPLFVPLVENGLIENEITTLTAEMYLKDLKDIDTLILGCTHFPIIKDTIQKVVGEKVQLIDSGKAVAEFVRDFLSENDMLSNGDKKGVCRYYVSDSVESFSNTAEMFLGEKVGENAQRIEIEGF